MGDPAVTGRLTVLPARSSSGRSGWSVWAAYRVRLTLTILAAAYLIVPTVLQWWSFRRQGGAELSAAITGRNSPLRLWLVAFAMTVGVVILLSIASDFREILTRHRRGRHR